MQKDKLIGMISAMKRIGFFSILQLSALFPALAGNQILPGTGLCDPHVVIHDNRAYLFATNDGSGMTDWWLWSSDDLVNWRHESTVKPKDVFTQWKPSSIDPEKHACWATFGAFRNGHVYWYVSAAPMAVLMADSPAGPWKDPIGKPFIPEGLPGSAYDMDILIDDDGTAYMVYGCYDYYIVRMNADMISLAEKPRPVQFDRKFGPYGFDRTDDKPSLHKRNGIYYLSWCSFYATSTNVYGPYTFKGSVLAPDSTAPDFLPVDTDLWYDRHGNFFTWHNQWFYICNDVSQPNRNGRESVIGYVHYRDDGTMAPVRLDKIGVGEYDAARNIEAEDYFAAEGVVKKERPAGGFEMLNLRQGSYLVYPKTRNLTANASVTFIVSSQTGGGMIEVREKQPDGKLLGSCQIPSTQNRWDVYQAVTCGLQNPAGTTDICLTFKGDGAELVRIDRFRFR
jgi:beta-xylosidase